MAAARTDLAMESGGLFEGKNVPGVTLDRQKCRGLEVTRVRVTSPQGADVLGKPMGTYLTLALEEGAGDPDRAYQAVAELLEGLLPRQRREALVVGLGNRLITPDAVGPRCVDRVLVTRHLGGDFFPVAALSTGVLGTTGCESSTLVEAVTQRLRPDCVIVVDALCARSMDRLCATVQLSDAGIVPGSGIGNARKALSRETLGVPVIALGVPTVVDGASLEGGMEGMLLTPKDIDSQVTRLSRVLGYGINAALHPHLSAADMDYLLG